MAVNIETARSFKSVPIDELPQIWDGWGKLVRSGLGISAFGVQIMDFPPDYTTKSHDEADSGQEELYLALHGSGELVIGRGEQRLPLEPGHVARAGPGVERTIATGPDGVRVLCVGGVPGEPYRPPDWTAGPEESMTREQPAGKNTPASLKQVIERYNAAWRARSRRDHRSTRAGDGLREPHRRRVGRRGRRA